MGKKLKILDIEDRPQFDEVGIQVFKHKEGEECYGEGGCSLLFSYGELEKEGIDKNDLLAHPEKYYVLLWNFRGQTSYYLKRRGDF